MLTKNEKQPVSIYCEIYSTKSKDFISTNKYTEESIDKVIEVIGKFTGIFDRRNFLFKGKKKNCYEEALKRKGKVKMTLLFDDNCEYEVSISHTKVTLPSNKKDYELVIVYGLSEKRPLILLTNRGIHSKDDLIKIVRLCFSRWRIEEYFRAKKQRVWFRKYKSEEFKINK